ncbi:glutamine synthetase [Ardenticatena maritima]|nr:type I glutamate--ammonia ligase [Ardenticatena maritima]GAP62412.1 glutamine synthetase [Ardenticatena maritima]
MPTFEEIWARIEAENVRFIRLQFTDIVGHVKNVTIPVEKLEDAITHGVWFDGSSIEGFARVAESDMYLKPDLSTFAILPWERREQATARIICDVYTPHGDPFPGDPREVLRRALAEAAELGFGYQTGPEPEFFLFKRDASGRPILEPHDGAGYFDESTDLGLDVRRQMVNALQALGIEVEATHHEVAPGQHEIDFRYDDALRTADNVVTLRIAVKTISQRNGLYASFMPKPISGINGSGMHTHQSLVRLETGENAFVDPHGEYGLSAIARWFIAGQLAHARALSAVVAPTVNSYKRLVPGYEAPVYVSWARFNRSALIRVPSISTGRWQSTRVELRSPDPSANPYLAFAAMLAAGLDGIRRQLEPPPPAEEDLFHLDARRLSRPLELLPNSLAEALDALESDEVIASALGPHLLSRFIEAKRREWDDYRAHVSTWEIERYFEIF